MNLLRIGNVWTGCNHFAVAITVYTVTGYLYEIRTLFLVIPDINDLFVNNLRRVLQRFDWLYDATFNLLGLEVIIHLFLHDLLTHNIVNSLEVVDIIDDIPHLVTGHCLKTHI